MVIGFRNSLVTTGQELVRRLHAAGAPIGAGTDFPGKGVIPGKDLHRELRLLADSGLSPREALHTSTRGPGPGAGGRPEEGRLVTGAPANLVLLRADPFVSLDALDAIHGVVLRGKWIDRPQLDAVLEISR